MKKLIWILALFISLQLYAQPKMDEANGLEALKIAFLSKQMNLTPEEAQKFWPVYNEYTTQFKKIRSERNGDELEFREKALNLLKRYKPDFVKSIGQDKFNKLLKSEGDWRQYLKDEINRRKQIRQELRRNRPNGKP